MRIHLVAAALAASVSAAHAVECNSPPFTISGTFCQGCTYETSLFVKRDIPCERPYRPNGWGFAANTQVIELLGNTIAKKAKHGIAGVEGNTFAYAPTKGYVGPDDFTVLMNYRLGKEVSKFYVHFDVKVE